MPARHLLPVLILAAALAGCASQVSAAGMTLSPAEAVKPSNPRMAKAVSVKAVGGGEDSDPLGGHNVMTGEVRRALLDSLRLAGLLADGPAPYALTVMSVKLDQPAFGFDITVTATVEYAVTDAAGKVVWSEVITTSEAKAVSDAFVGITRLTLATEGAMRKNFAQLVQKLGAAPLPGPLGVN